MSASTATYSTNPFLRSLRPRQWSKNLIVFAAPLFAVDFSLQTLLSCLLAFILFCLTSSSFYLFNDILDVESDRQHPVKRKRPIAAGEISIVVAVTMAISFLGIALAIGWYFKPGLGTAITSYAILQILYNYKLKHKVIVDVSAIAAGFVFRAFGGASAAGIQLSSWFLLCTAMLALFLGIEKRKAELRLAKLHKSSSRRTVLWRYNLSLLNRMENTVTAGTIMTYSLWSSGPKLNGASTSWMMLTIPFVLYGIFRYQLLSDPQEISRKRDKLGQDFGGKTERPEEILLTDRPLQITVLSWLLTSILVLGLQHIGIIH